MKSTLNKLAVLSTLAIAMLFTSCGKKDTPEVLIDELATQFTELATAVSGVKDKESAEAAATKIDEIGDAVVAIAERMEKVPEPSEEEQKKLKEKMDKVSDEMTEKMGKSMMELAKDPEAMKIVGEAMEKFGKKMDDLESTFEKFGK